MKVCVVGAGGVGGLLAAVLRRAGVDVSLLVTERHLTAIRRNGLALIAPSGRFSVEIQAELDPRAIGACDVVIATAKMWAVEALAPTLRPLLGENTVVIPVQNGIDAPGILAKALGWEHVVYGSASMNAALEEPGVIRQKNPQYGFTVAEAQGQESARLLKVKETFGAAGVPVEIGTDGPALLWDKFIGQKGTHTFFIQRKPSIRFVTASGEPSRSMSASDGPHCHGSTPSSTPRISANARCSGTAIPA